MRNLYLSVLVLLACIVTACAPSDEVLPPSPPRALDVSNVGGEAWLSPEDFESSENLRTRWAPPWDVWADDDYIMYTTYNAVMGRPAYLNFYLWGDNWNRNIGGQVPLVYGQAYILNAQTKKWSPFSLEGKYSTKYTGFMELEKTTQDYTYIYYDEDGNEQTGVQTDIYFSAPATLITPEKFSEGDNYVATYICSSMAAVSYRNYKYTYACGCIDDNIESCGRWNIQRLTVNPAPTCGNNRCEEGEDPWSCTQDCLDGPNAPVELADEEAKGADFCMLWNAGDVNCEMEVINTEEIQLQLTNNNEETVRFDELVVKQNDDAVDCYPITVEVPAGETVVVGASCTPAITSIGATDFSIESFVTNSDGSGYEVWGWARATVDNYRADAPTDSDAVLIDFEQPNGATGVSGVWMTEGVTKTLTVNEIELQATVDAVDINGRVRLTMDGTSWDTLTEGQAAVYDGVTTAKIKDVIVRDNVQQPPNSINLALFDGTNYVEGALLHVGDTKTYTIDGKSVTAEVVQVAGRRASVRVYGNDLDETGLHFEGGYAYISGENSLRVFNIYYQGTPDQCPQEVNSCNGNKATWYGCFDFGEYGFNTMSWPMQIGSVTTCDEICSNGYCQLDGTGGYQYEGDTYLYSLDNEWYEVTTLFITEEGDAVKFLVNSEVTDLLGEGDWDGVAGIRIEVLGIFDNGEYGRAVEFVLRPDDSDSEADEFCTMESDAFACDEFSGVQGDPALVTIELQNNIGNDISYAAIRLDTEVCDNYITTTSWPQGEAKSLTFGCDVASEEFETPITVEYTLEGQTVTQTIGGSLRLSLESPPSSADS